MSVKPLDRNKPSAHGSDAEGPGQGLIGALHRAMPFTRLVDCGMDHADARELLDRTASGEPWDCAAAAIGERQAERSAEAEAKGRRSTAVEAGRYAVAAFNFAQMAHNSDTPAKRRGYQRFLRAVDHLVTLSQGRIEPVAVPYLGGHLTGWLQLPSIGEPAGTVIVWGGLSGWGTTYLPIADALVSRRLACLLVEGPGQGRPRLQDGIYATGETLDGFSSFIDYILADPRLNAAIGIQGNSFGGLFAAHLAATDPRIAACVINGAPAAPQVPEFRGAREQILALLGTADPDHAAAQLARLRFGPDTHRIDTPCLILQGGKDPLATPNAQAPFLAAATHPASQFLLWPDGEHTLYNHAAERNALTADWFKEQFTGLPDVGSSTAAATARKR